MGEIDHILLAPGIGGCRWPLSPLLERHRHEDGYPVRRTAPLVVRPRRRYRFLTIFAAQVLKH